MCTNLYLNPPSYVCVTWAILLVATAARWHNPLFSSDADFVFTAFITNFIEFNYNMFLGVNSSCILLSLHGFKRLSGWSKTK